MLNSKILQSAYIDLYTELRKYIWDFKTVEKIAELETATYQTFPDIDDVRNKFNSLELDIRSSAIDLNEDIDLQQALQEFSEVLNDDSDIYAKLTQVREVI